MSFQNSELQELFVKDTDCVEDRIICLGATTVTRFENSSLLRRCAVFNGIYLRTFRRIIQRSSSGPRLLRIAKRLQSTYMLISHSRVPVMM